MSLGVPSRPFGTRDLTRVSSVPASCKGLIISVLITPGAIAFTLIPCGDSSIARASVRAVTPPFEAV